MMASASNERLERDAQLAAAMEREVGVEHIADVYAAALLGAGDAAGQTVSVLEELESLVSDVLDEFPDLERVLASAAIAHEDRAGVIDRVLGGRASPLLINFLKVVSRRGRMNCLRAMAHRARVIFERRMGQVEVTVTTAAPLEPAARDRLRETLQPLIGGEPLLHERVDPALIGGVVVRLGDMIYDASVARQLENLRQQMIDRSAHEIQSRRDRFRHPEGN